MRGENAKVTYDIFISYRRQDAEAHACMLYRDLVDAGYTVFFDHKTLGAGNFVNNIYEAIDNSTDFLLLLSNDALGERIYEVDDILHKEISYAFQKKKQIVGIMLSGFKGFPNKLPEDIENLPYVNCLYGKMEYYDAMFSRLISGQFLQSVPRGKTKSDAEQLSMPRGKKDTLEWFRSFDITKKQQYMKFLLDLAHEFNTSASCMRLYKYLDCYDRNRGIKETPDYDGVIPTDYTTYLNFFETLYLILITETINISLVDEMYRFRFFAACNNPVIQKSELLALGYQYPNIMDLYDFWSEYIRKRYLSQCSNTSLSDAYPQFERDLHSTYRLYTFAQQPQNSQAIRFINRQFKRIDLIFSLLDSSALEMLGRFQTNICFQKETGDNAFEPLTESELAYSLANNICVGAFEGEKLAAVLVLIPKPQRCQSVWQDFSEHQDVGRNDLLEVDRILVAKVYRGFGLQRAFLRLTEFIAEKCGYSLVGAALSSQNTFGISNLVKSGFQFAGSRSRYGLTRDYFIKEIEVSAKTGPAQETAASGS